LDELCDCAEQVFDELGPNYSEVTYQNAFEVECQLRQIRFIRQPTINISYKGNIVGFQRPDLIVDGQVVIEMKACRETNSGHRNLQNWEFQLKNYLKDNTYCGLLVVFGTTGVECRRIQTCEEQKRQKRQKIVDNQPSVEISDDHHLQKQLPLDDVADDPHQHQKLPTVDVADDHHLQKQLPPDDVADDHHLQKQLPPDDVADDPHVENFKVFTVHIPRSLSLSSTFD
jgi:GxxExxY protein